MAKKKGPNKSQAIRGVLEQNPKASAKEVVDALGQKGIKVAVGLVYMVKGKMLHVKGQHKRKAKRLATARKSLNGTGTISVESITKVKALADEVGGMANLKALVTVLAE